MENNDRAVTRLSFDSLEQSAKVRLLTSAVVTLHARIDELRDTAAADLGGLRRRIEELEKGHDAFVECVADLLRAVTCLRHCRLHLGKSCSDCEHGQEFPRCPEVFRRPPLRNADTGELIR